MNISDILLIILLINFLFNNRKLITNTNNKSKYNKLYEDIKNTSYEYSINLINYFFTLANEAGIIKQSTDIIKLNSITFEINRDNDKNTNIYKALLNYLSNNNNSKFLKYYSDTYYVINSEIFNITKELKCKIIEHKFSQTGELEKYKFEIFSTDEYITVNDIKEFIINITEDYETNKNYTLGRNQYYFNEIIQQIPKNVDGTYRYDVAPKTLSFSMVKFNSNRSMKNIFGSHLHELKERVFTFLNNREWYINKGLPYTLGILLSGPPGTGKTSIIKALANDSKRHIINVNFRDCTTKSQLYKLFYDEELIINNTGEQGKEEQINIPLDKRIYVIEDIDCMNDVVLDREILNFNPNIIDDTDIYNINPVETTVNDNLEEKDINLVKDNIQNTINPLEQFEVIDISKPFITIDNQIVENNIPIVGGDINEYTNLTHIDKSPLNINKINQDDIYNGEIDMSSKYSSNFQTSGFTQIEEEVENEPNNIDEKLSDLISNRDKVYEECKENVKMGIINEVPSLGQIDKQFERVVNPEEVELTLESINIEKTSKNDFENDYYNFLKKEDSFNSATYHLDNPIIKKTIEENISTSNIEEILLTDIEDEVNKKKLNNQSNKTKSNNNDEENMRKFQYIMNRREQAELKKDEHPEKLTLSDILNIFDGVLETPGRIIIATSNHPYVLDPALIRPGRIDLKIETGYCDAEMIVDMFIHFYGDEYIDLLNDETILSIVELRLTPAELNNYMLIYKNDINNAINAILKKNIIH
jgi:cytidylate kinase